MACFDGSRYGDAAVASNGPFQSPDTSRLDQLVKVHIILLCTRVSVGPVAAQCKEIKFQMSLLIVGACIKQDKHHFTMGGRRVELGPERAWMKEAFPWVWITFKNVGAVDIGGIIGRMAW